METRGYAPGWLHMSCPAHITIVQSVVEEAGLRRHVSLGSRRIPGSWIQKESDIITPAKSEGVWGDSVVPTLPWCCGGLHQHVTVVINVDVVVYSSVLLWSIIAACCCGGLCCGGGGLCCCGGLCCGGLRCCGGVVAVVCVVVVVRRPGLKCLSR